MMEKKLIYYIKDVAQILL